MFSAVRRFGSQCISDPFWDDTVLAMRMDGVDNGTNFQDDKGNVVTVYGGAKTVTSTSKFGGSSAYFDGNGDYLFIPANNEFALGTGDFTIDFFVMMPNVTPKNCWRAILSIGDGHSTTGAITAYLPAGTGNTVGLILNGSHIISNQPASVNDGQWHHIAVVRESGQIKYYADGVLLVGISGGTAITQNTVIIGTSFDCIFGGYPDSYFIGYIDDLRITKAVRWSSNFQPPQQSFSCNV